MAVKTQGGKREGAGRKARPDEHKETNMTNTAAGPVEVISAAKSAVRGGTTMFFGSLRDGRFVVTSRFQYEIRTTDRAKAERKFEELCRA